MIVRIRFGHGRPVTRREGKNSSAARLLSSALTLISISLGIFAFWRLGQDLGFLDNFVFSDGLLSHWQVWMAAAAAAQYVGWRLNRYSRRARAAAIEYVAEESVSEDKTPAEKTAARV